MRKIPIDLATASSEDTEMTIAEMLHNKDNWTFAADLIHHGQLPLKQYPELAKQFPEFWLQYIATPTPGGKTNGAH